jgi:hypothetical protein
MMTDEELDKLAQDVQQHGLREPVTLWHDGARQYLLDGRNRLEALTRAGIEITPDHLRDSSAVDPTAHVISKNLLRRHLTKEQQATLIVRALEAADSTDGAKLARSVTRGNDGRMSGSTKDRVFDAAVREAKKVGISSRTVKRARAKVRGSATQTSEIGTPSDAPTSTPPTSTAATEIKCALEEVSSVIENAVEQWPPDSSLAPLITRLRAVASRLTARDRQRKKAADAGRSR